jgi:host factor-I protein
MAMDNERLQNDFLNSLRRNGARVSIFLTSGERLDGQIKSFDMYAVSFNCPDPRLIVKTCIASVAPAGKLATMKPRVSAFRKPAAEGAAKTPVIQRKVRRVPLERP